jgi:hypothetical protein
MDGIKNNEVTYIRETAYLVDTTTHQPDMKKVDKITVYSLGYFGTTPLLIKLLAVMGSDTNKLVRNEAYSYNPANGLLTGYQSVSDEGFQMGSAGQVARDINGIITGKSTAITFDLKQPAKPTDYKVMCSGGTGTNVQSVIFKYTSNGKEVTDRIHMEYDLQNRLSGSVFNYADGNSSDKNTQSYDSKGRLQQQQWMYTHTTTEYHPATEGTVAFGVYIPGTAATTTKKTVTDTRITDYEYDAKGNITTISFSYNGKLQSKEVYTYTITGVPETVKVLNEKGQLTGLRKLSCK